MVSGEQIHATQVYSRDSLPVGKKIIGPTIIIEKTGTTVVEPGWQAEITPRYDIVLTRYLSPPKSLTPTAQKLDALSPPKSLTPTAQELDALSPPIVAQKSFAQNRKALPNFEGFTEDKTFLGEYISPRISTAVDPVMLEIFNNLFMSIAEQMGATLANTAYSVNIKERLDFSCAVFDQAGQLIANAPHMPVHLGSMGDSVQTVIAEQGDSMQPGGCFCLK
jgi:5-oxoprolinase (ATP-hydrolysing)